MTYFEWLANQIEHDALKDEYFLQRSYHTPFLYNLSLIDSSTNLLPTLARITNVHDLRSESGCTDYPKYISVLEMVVALDRRGFYKRNDIKPIDWIRKHIREYSNDGIIFRSVYTVG